jgi:hypothetical protein
MYNPSAVPGHRPAPSESNGQLARENPGGRVGSYRLRQAQFQRVIQDSTTAEDVRSLVRVLLALAKSGNLAAIKVLLQYTVGI